MDLFGGFLTFLFFAGLLAWMTLLDHLVAWMRQRRMTRMSNEWLYARRTSR